METQKIGIREFRDNLATHLLKSEAPVAITRHGDTVAITSRHVADGPRAIALL